VTRRLRMSIASPFSEVLHRALVQLTRGVVGLVDDLLVVCRERGLQLDWHADRCRARRLGNGTEEWIAVDLRKSVFRAILARVAVLCNEQNPNSVSPYGGQAEVSVGSNPATRFRVAFVNTTEEQRLELMPVGSKAESARGKPCDDNNGTAGE
jgi:hypothetical protein